jgi:hypothetical protein
MEATIYRFGVTEDERKLINSDRWYCQIFRFLFTLRCALSGRKIQLRHVPLRFGKLDGEDAETRKSPKEPTRAPANVLHGWQFRFRALRRGLATDRGRVSLFDAW